jgi:PBSX family phage terminase large subunit
MPGPKTDNIIITAPTYKTIAQATLPKFLQVWGKFGDYRKGDQTFIFHSGITAYIRSLNEPNAIEGITDVRRIWLDEGGLISRYAWENVMGRAAFLSAQIMITTTPYSLNWLYEMWQQWKKGARDDVEFISFRSIDNPHFPSKEYERQKTLLDPRRFAMKYDGEFGKMEGLVYEDLPLCKACELPAGTRYFAGVDWGFTDPFVITIRAYTPDGIHYRVGEFFKSQMTMSEIVEVCKARRQLFDIEMFICDPSRPDSILELNRAGLPATGGQNDIRLGIDKQIELMRTNKWFLFEHENPYGKDEYNTYHYPEPKDRKIDDDSKDQLPVDANNHGCDADRYATMYIENVSMINKVAPTMHSHSNTPPKDNLERLNWLKRGGSSRGNVI